MKPLVSILLPAYNAEAWLSDTLRSAIAQTWQEKEIIVVDDGSADQTLAIARQFESDRLTVVTQKNQGAAATRNNAYSLSHGDYIQWLDADDLRTSALFYRGVGASSCTAAIEHNLFQVLSGVIFLPSNGWCARWARTFTCRPPPGSSVAS
jgi:glycosyltransferase involved in cell wall biosynthesis